MSKINKIKLSGTSYDIEDKNAPKSVELTQAEYDALVSAGTVDTNTFYIITDASGATVTSAVTSGSTAVITSGGVYSQMGGLKMLQITQSAYDALVSGGAVDSNTIYYIVN